MGWVWGLAFVTCSVLYYSCSGHVIGDKEMDVAYKDIGDLNIGGLFSVSEFKQGEKCNLVPTGEFFNALQYMETMAYTVGIVNMNATLLPGIKLGFVFLDLCSSIRSAMIQATRFMPRSRPSHFSLSNETNTLRSYKVVGVLVTPESHFTAPISVLYGGAGLPLLGFSGMTTDMNKEKWPPTFFRLSPSKKVIIYAMLKFMKESSFTYFSVVLQNDFAAEMLQSALTKLSLTYGMCLSGVILVSRYSDYHSVYQKLTSNKVKVVVAFTNPESAELLLSAAEARDSSGRVIWIVTDSWMHLMRLGRLTHNAFLFSSSTLAQNGVLSKEESLESNPWYKAVMNSKVCKDSNCLTNIQKTLSEKNDVNKKDMRDAVLAFAHGLHNLISDKCQGAKSYHATACFDEHSLEFVSYLKNVRFPGKSGDVIFDNERIKIMNLTIYQEVSSDNNSNGLKIVAKYNVALGKLYDIKRIHLDKIRFAINESLKETLCQKPCNASEYKSVEGCCWTCRACQSNEIVTENQMACSKCPPFQWPEMQSGVLSYCKDIPPSHLRWFDALSIAILAAGATCAVRTVYLFWSANSDIQVNSSPVLEASSTLKNYRYSLLVAIALGLGAIPNFLHYPTVHHCYIAQILFVFSLLMEYGVVLHRSVNIYQKCFSDEEESRWIKKWTYCIAVSMLLLLQIITFVLLLLKYPIRTVKQQPLVGENFVELYCDMPFPLAVAFLVSAITLLMLCAVASLKTQDQELSASHSRFAPTYVYVSLVMWVVFMPAYFTAFRGRMRMYYQIAAILMNDAVSLLLNFTPEFMILICSQKRKLSRSMHIGVFPTSIPTSILLEIVK